MSVCSYRNPRESDVGFTGLFSSVPIDDSEAPTLDEEVTGAAHGPPLDFDPEMPLAVVCATVAMPLFEDVRFGFGEHVAVEIGAPVKARSCVMEPWSF